MVPELQRLSGICRSVPACCGYSQAGIFCHLVCDVLHCCVYGRQVVQKRSYGHLGEGGMYFHVCLGDFALRSQRCASVAPFGYVCIRVVEAAFWILWSCSFLTYCVYGSTGEFLRSGDGIQRICQHCCLLLSCPVGAANQSNVSTKRCASRIGPFGRIHWRSTSGTIHSTYSLYGSGVKELLQGRPNAKQVCLT